MYFVILYCLPGNLHSSTNFKKTFWPLKVNIVVPAKQLLILLLGQ